MGHGIETEVCQGTGSGVGVRKTQEKMACEVHGRVHRWVQSLGGGRVGQSGCACMRKVGMMEIGCGGYLGGTPPIGKLEPPGLISGEMVLQDGWQGWTDMSKCSNAAGFGTHAVAHAQSAGGRWGVVVHT